MYEDLAYVSLVCEDKFGKPSRLETMLWITNIIRCQNFGVLLPDL